MLELQFGRSESMTTLFLSFNLKENAERFIGALLDHGVSTDDVSVVSRESGVTYDASKIERESATGLTTTTATDFGKGALFGSGFGATLGFAAGLAALLVPGVGLVLGGGALATAIAGAAATTAGGALAGGIAGYLRDMGVEGEVPDEFDRDYADDYVIVGVAPGAISREEVQALGEKYHASRTTFDQPTAAAVPVEKEVVKAPVVDGNSGRTTIETIEERIPEGVDRVEAIPTSPVIPVPPEGAAEGQVLAEPAPVGHIERVELEPSAPGKPGDLIETEVTLTPGMIQKKETVINAPGADKYDPTPPSGPEQVGIETTEVVEVDPVLGTAEREILETPVIAEEEDLEEAEKPSYEGKGRLL
jgi:hypothetical protein